jgi:cytochrome oxidase Cu insertion factor (SCO1/SenC/PrrC family)
MNNSAIPYWLTFAVLLAALYGGFKWYQVERSNSGVESSEISLPPLEEFTLTTSDGKPFRSAEMKGKVWVVSFFFSTCPGSCKRLNANIKHLSSLDELADVTWVSISVDPATDTVEVLDAYAKTMNADPQRWLFARGDFDYVRRIAHDMLKVGGVSLKSHNDFAVIIDKQGEIAGMFNASSTADSKKGIKTIEQCLAEPSPPAINSQRAGASPPPEPVESKPTPAKAA